MEILTFSVQDCIRIKSDLPTTVTLLQYSVFFYICIFTSELYTFIFLFSIFPFYFEELPLAFLCKVGLVVMNSFSFCLSGKIFIFVFFFFLRNSFALYYSWSAGFLLVVVVFCCCCCCFAVLFFVFFFLFSQNFGCVILFLSGLQGF